MPDPAVVSVEQVTTWFIRQTPDDWGNGPLEVRVDREELLVFVLLPTRDGADDAAMTALEAANDFRERTRDVRIAIAAEAESLFGRKVSWIARYGDQDVPFSTLSVPVMTRLKFDERAVLDTLVAAGVARSRSDALGWCVRLVAKHEGDWLKDLREAMTQVAEVRRQGPS